MHYLTPVHELICGLLAGAAVYADRGHNAGADESTILADTGIRLALRAHHKRIKTLYSRLVAMNV